VLFIIIVSGTYASAAGNDCDVAQNYFWQGQMGGEREQALQYYLEAVELCPGFIRPYELIGNYYRNQNDGLQAIVYFKKAAELGSVNYKLYYLLGLLYYSQNEYAQALFYVNKSLGFNDIYEKWPKLDSAVFDAKAVQAIFEQSGFNEVTLIINQEATQRRILTELYSELPKKVARDDRVVFYFAGHGTTMKADSKPPTGYIIPVESGLTDFPATAVSMGQIRDICSHINAKHIIFVMDCCYAGQILISD